VPAVNYQCSICNHMYDPDRDGNGAAFEDLPDSFVCPICGSPSRNYKPHDAYVCTVCSHVYDPMFDGGAAAFEDLPDSWVCPVCGKPKSAYSLVPLPTPPPSPSPRCPPDSDLVVTDDGRDECLWTSGAHGLTIPPTASGYCEYIGDGYFGYRFEGDYECADSAQLSGNFCLWEDGQRGVTIPSGATADCGHLSEGRIGMVLPTESAETVV